MPEVIVVHTDRLVRERIASALVVRGMGAVTVGDVEAALELAREEPLTAVLVDPRILLRESFDVQARLSMVAGRPVRVVALTHVAGPAEAEAFQRHGATLLIQPVKNADMIAVLLGAPGKPLGLAEAEALREKARVGAPRPRPILEDGADDGEVPFAPVGPDGSPPLVLLVDDDDDVRDMLADALTGKGYDVHCTTSVPAAFRFLRAGNRCDLIVSDIHMPIFDGFEFKDELDRTLDRAIPFIGITGEDDAEKYELALRLGAVALMSKPVRLRRLWRLVRAALSRTDL